MCKIRIVGETPTIFIIFKYNVSLNNRDVVN